LPSDKFILNPFSHEPEASLFETCGVATGQDLGNVLDVRPIGVKHNFFEIGDHSVQAVRLMHCVKQSCGKSLPLATLLHAPTVDQFAPHSSRGRMVSNLVLFGAHSS